MDLESRRLQALARFARDAADPPAHGQTMGSVASLNSLMAAIAPTVAAPLLGIVAHRPAGDVWIGLPFFFCALVQAAGALIACFRPLGHCTSSRSTRSCLPRPKWSRRP